MLARVTHGSARQLAVLYDDDVAAWRLPQVDRAALTRACAALNSGKKRQTAGIVTPKPLVLTEHPRPAPWKLKRPITPITEQYDAWHSATMKTPAIGPAG
jgi:hypothetical protein